MFFFSEKVFSYNSLCIWRSSNQLCFRFSCQYGAPLSSVNYMGVTTRLLGPNCVHLRVSPLKVLACSKLGEVFLPKTFHNLCLAYVSLMCCRAKCSSGRCTRRRTEGRRHGVWGRATAFAAPPPSCPSTGLAAPPASTTRRTRRSVHIL